MLSPCMTALMTGWSSRALAEALMNGDMKDSFTPYFFVNSLRFALRNSISLLEKMETMLDKQPQFYRYLSMG